MDKRRMLLNSVMAYASRQGAMRGGKYSRTVTLAAPASTLTNFPVLVRVLNDSTFKGHVSSAYGYDVSFQKMDGTELDFELDYYDASTGSGAWWVRIPSLVADSTTTIKMLYGDATLTTDQSTPATVWAGYSAVCHMLDTNQTTQKNSVTGGTCAYNADATMNSQFLIQAGATGKSCQLTTTVPRSSDGTLDNSPLLSLDVPTSGNGTFSCLYAETSIAYNFYLCASNANLQRASTASVYGYGLNVTYPGPATGWRQFAVVGGSRYRVYVDGTGITASNQVAPAQIYSTTFKCLAPALNTYAARTHTYAVDEVRLYSGTRTDAWLAYEYNQALNHVSYTTYGDEQAAGRTR